MTEEKNSFVVFTDIKEILDELDDKQVAALFRGMVDYQETGKDPNFRGTLKYIFIPIRQQMDRNNEKWDKTKAARAESGRKGGLKSAEVRAKQKEANQANASSASSKEANQANQAVTVTDTVTVTGTVNVTGTVGDEMSPDKPSPSSIISYLNQKSGASYQADEGTSQLIADLIGMGYTETDIRTVIDRKCSEWLADPKMRQYLRPSTLFGNKFQEYLSAPEPYKDDSQPRRKTKDDLIRERDEKLQILADIRSRLETAETNSVEFGFLLDQEALAQDRLDLINNKLEAMG